MEVLFEGNDFFKSTTEPLIVSIAGYNELKKAAVVNVLDRLGCDYKINQVADAPSNVTDIPSSVDERNYGAMNRALFAHMNSNYYPDIAIGIEGGIHEMSGTELWSETVTLYIAYTGWTISADSDSLTIPKEFDYNNLGKYCSGLNVSVQDTGMCYGLPGDVDERNSRTRVQMIQETVEYIFVNKLKVKLDGY
jgi:non-canonical (house-cleaning) NTP pyrophosphatase